MTKEYYTTLGALGALVHRLSEIDPKTLGPIGQAKIGPVLDALRRLQAELLAGGSQFSKACQQFDRALDTCAANLQSSAFDLAEGFESVSGLEAQVTAVQQLFHHMIEELLPHLSGYTALTQNIPSLPPPSST